MLSFEDDSSLQRACITQTLYDVLLGHIHINMTVQNMKCNMNGRTKIQQIKQIISLQVEDRTVLVYMKWTLEKSYIIHL